MPRRTLNTKAATTWLKDFFQIVAGKVAYTTLKRREHSGATDATRQSEIREYIYQQETGSYLPAEKANTPPRIRNVGSEEVETKVIKEKRNQRRNHVGRYHPRKCKQQFAENPVVRVSIKSYGRKRVQIQPSEIGAQLNGATGRNSALIRAVSPKWSAIARKWAKRDARTTKIDPGSDEPRSIRSGVLR